MSERIYAVVDDGIVVNTIVADDDFAAIIAPDHEAVLEITGMTPMPGIGWAYDADADVFVSPQPFPSWLLDEQHDWQAPTLMPDEGMWSWDEATLSWVEVSLT